MTFPDQPVPEVVLLTLSPEVAGHLTMALQGHQKCARRAGMRVPPELAHIEKMLAFRARQGQGGTQVEDVWTVPEAQTVNPRLVTYAGAADLLAVGERTVKRLVAARVLHAVHIGNSARLRVSDLEAYIEQLAAQQKGA